VIPNTGAESAARGRAILEAANPNLTPAAVASGASWFGGIKGLQRRFVPCKRARAAPLISKVSQANLLTKYVLFLRCWLAAADNGGFGKEQLAWLRAQIAEAAAEDERVSDFYPLNHGCTQDTQVTLVSSFLVFFLSCCGLRRLRTLLIDCGAFARDCAPRLM
jgi:hypothetical protein